MPGTDPSKHARGPREDRGVVVARIVKAARTSFAENGWAGTSMRAVARDADVDPSLVHYYFKSKEDLLDACTMPPEGFLEAVQSTATAPIDERGEIIVRTAMRLWSHPEVGEILRSIVLTAAHEPRTLEKLRATVTASVIGAISAEIPGEARMVRASYVSTQIIGLALVRYIWRLEPMASLPDEDVVAVVGPTVQRYLNGELPLGSSTLTMAHR